ncbi:MAG: alpha/beta hydrolase fold domain-containing protein [Acidobacteriota bacterium]|nr:alpha/beta hydrolase fold domain-containing protein [Acidobacteriota bacterium]
MPSPEMTAAAEVLAQAIPAVLAAPVADQRATWEALAGPVPGDVSVTATDVAGLPAEVVRAPGAAEDAVVVHLHGGGYVIGSPRSHRLLAARLSAASGATVVVPEYRLAPEDPFPAAVEDARAVVEAVVAEVGPARVAVSGDSAGGGLAVAVLAAWPAGRSGPAAALCFSPWADLSATGVLGDGGADPGERGEVVLSREWLAACARSYLGAHDAADPLASPVHARLGGLPPLLVQVGTTELLLGDARRLVAAARAAGAEAELVEVAGAVHLWMLLVPEAPESASAYERAGAFLRARLGAAAVP